MNPPTIKENIFKKSKVYSKNLKARGQKLQISKYLSKKKEAINHKNIIINNYKKKDIDIVTNFDKNNILEEIKNTKNRIEQYENYLKHSLHPNISTEIKRTNIISPSPFLKSDKNFKKKK